MHDRQWPRAALEEAANAVAFDLPEKWPGRITDLLERLQDETDAEHYEEFLRCVKGAIGARLEDGRW